MPTSASFSANPAELEQRLAAAKPAIEAKATAHVHERDAAPLAAAKAYLPHKTRRVIATLSGPPRRLAGDVEVLPLARLLREIRS
jgi:hypothetical protein